MKLDERNYRVLLCTVSNRLLAAMLTNDITTAPGAFSMVKDATRFAGYLLAAAGIEMERTSPAEALDQGLITTLKVKNRQIISDLETLGIHTILHLRSIPKDTLLQMPGMSKRRILQINLALKKLGLPLIK